MKARLIILMNIAILLAISCTGNKEEHLRTRFEKALQRMTITWMQNNMDLNETSFYRPGLTTIVDTLWIFPTRYDDPELARIEAHIEAISRESFRNDIRDMDELEDIAYRADSLKKIKVQYMEANKLNAGWIIRHDYTLDDETDHIFLGINKGLTEIYGETLPPGMSEKIIKKSI